MWPADERYARGAGSDSRSLSDARSHVMSMNNPASSFVRPVLTRVGCRNAVRREWRVGRHGSTREHTAHGHTDQLAHAGATAAAAVPDFDTGTRAAGSSTRFSTTSPTGKAVVSDKTLHTPVFLQVNTTLHGITRAGPCRGHASTLRLGPVNCSSADPRKAFKEI